MLHPVTFRAWAITACGCLLACDASALSLGRARGAALIGRPLEIAIPITLDSPADKEGPCASGELLYGDQRVGRPPTMRWEPGAGAEGTLYISSAVPVDEPSVTLSLRVGCGQSTTRRYVLLSELPTEVEGSAFAARPSTRVPAPAAASSAPVARAPAAAAPGSSEPAARGTSPRRQPATPAAQAAAPAQVLPAPPPSRARRPAAAAAPQPQPQSRLKVEPLEPGVERDPVLRLTAELATQLAADPAQRQAAAALWAALQKAPDEAIQDSIRLQAVQRDVDALRSITRQNAAAVTQMRAQVEQARSERQTASFLVLGLAAVLAALLAALAWRWHRSRQVDRVGRWFEANGEAQASTPVALDTATQPPVSAPAPRTAAPAAPRKKGSKAAAAAAAAEATAAAAAAVAVTGAAASPAGPSSVWAPAEEFQASRGGTVRMVGVEELIDVHDKADFFLSIGAVDQAMAVLEAHVHDQVETSALPWMDLLELYHAHGRHAEYERLRAEFQQRFSAQVPDFEHFDQPTASLENYGRALSRIVALWPSPKVLEVIEESIFRKPGLPGAEPFSLEAYRELVLLYHIAKDVAPLEHQEARPTTFSDTSLHPLNMLDAPEPVENDREKLMIPPASVRLGVDIDLGLDAEEDATSVQPALRPGDLPPLDFDVSSYDDVEGGKPRHKRG